MSFDVSFKRIAADEEVRALVDMARLTFSHTFRHYRESDLSAYLEKELSYPTLRAEVQNQENGFYFVLLNGKRAGYVKWIFPTKKYQEHVPLPAERPFLLERFYFLPDFQGRGLAPIALTFTLSFARHQALADYVYLSVWDKNYRAQRFYQRHGFRTIGSFEYPVGEEIDHEILLGLPLK